MAKGSRKSISRKSRRKTLRKRSRRKSISRKSRRKTLRKKSGRKTKGGIIRVTHEKETHVDPSIYRGGKSAKQAVLFSRDKWNKSTAKKWLTKHNIKPIKEPHLTTNFIRYRVENPNKFKRFATIKTKDDIDLIIGFK